MIPRLLVTAGAVVPVAAHAIAADRGATVTTSTPTVWTVLGYPFEAGSMIAALCACAAVRFYVVQRDYKQHRLQLDVPVFVLAMMLTAAMIVRLRPDPVIALLWGTGLGMLGASIITIAKSYVDKGLGALGIADPGDKPPPA